MTVLVLTTVLPGGQRSGGEIVSQAVVDAISATGRDVRVIGYRRPGDTRAERPGEVCAGSRPIETAAAGVRVVPWLVRALLAGAPYSAAKYDSRRYARTASAAMGDGVDVVVADHAQVAFAVRRAVPVPTPLVFVAHNVEARVYADLAAAASGRGQRWINAREARTIATAENALVARAAQVWTLTDDDRDQFRALDGSADVRALEVPARRLDVDAAEPAYDIALIGSWSWEANRAGLEWFASHVVPLLPRDVSVRVAGAGASWLRGRHPNVRVCGRVADAGEFLGRARAIAVPAVAGGGVQVKTLDAVASGVPVVSTPTAVRGLGDLPASVSVAADPPDFAASLQRAARDGRPDRARAEALSWSAARRRRFESAVGDWLAEVTGAANVPGPAAAAGRGSATRLR